MIACKYPSWPGGMNFKLHFKLSKLPPGQKPFVLVGLLRLLACMLIFLHHYLKLIKSIDSYSISTNIAISLFLFISGFLIPTSRKNSHRWFLGQIVKIYITWWIIFIPLVIFNFFLHTRNTNFVSIAIDFLGGTLFNKNPLYEAPWFISLILGIYLTTYISKTIASKKEALILPLLLATYYYIIGNVYIIGYAKPFMLSIWLVSFYIGYVYSSLEQHKLLPSITDKIVVTSDELNMIIFSFGALTYPFYLVHGPVMQVLFNVIKLDKEFTFVIALIVSVVISVIINNCASYIRQRIFKIRFPLI